MFGYQPTSQDVAALLAKRGYVVLGIDSYFNGERKGTGPAGNLETQDEGLRSGDVPLQTQPMARADALGDDVAR